MDLSDQLFSRLSLLGKEAAKDPGPPKDPEHATKFGGSLPFHTSHLHMFKSPTSNVSFFFGRFSCDLMLIFVLLLNSLTFKMSGI